VANLENKLSKAYEKVGKKIGLLYDIYDSESYQISPIDSLNWMNCRQIALTVSDFTNSKNPGFKFYECYVSFDEIKPGSVLVEQDSEKVFMVMNHETNHGVNAMECFNTITINSLSSSYDGTGQSATEYVRDLPCTISISGADTSSSIIAQSRSGSNFTHSATIRFQTIVKLDISIGDSILDDNNNKYEVMAVDYSSTGYKLIANGIRP